MHSSTSSLLTSRRARRGRYALFLVAALTACRSQPAGMGAASAEVPPVSAAPGFQALRANGAVLHYVDTALASARKDLPPIVLVHGVRGGAASVARSVAAFSTERRTLAYSRRWHTPNSVADDGQVYSPALHAADLGAFMTRLGVRSADIVGTSYGGLVALEFARQHPERVRALVLTEPAAFGLLPTVQKGDSLFADARAHQDIVRRLLQRGDSVGALSYYASLLGGRTADSTELSRVPEEARARALATGMPDFRRQMMTPFDTYMPRLTCADLSKVRMPLLLVRGAGTLPAFSATVDAIAQCLPHARVVTLPTGRGHGAVSGQDPVRYNATIQDFLRSVAP